MYPFRCTECSKISYSDNVTVEPPRCCEKPLQRLVKICLLIPCPPGVLPVHISTPSPGLVEPNKWVVACGYPKFPHPCTTEPSACTCKGCREYASKLFAQAGWELDPSLPENGDGNGVTPNSEDLQEADIRISLPSDPNDCGCQ